MNKFGESKKPSRASPGFKGQYFILGSILLIVLFFLGLPLFKPFLSSPSNDLPYLADNIKREFPAAFNLGLNESNELSVLRNFTLFLNDTLSDHLVDFRVLWVFSKNVTTRINVTAGNYLGHGILLSVNVSDPDGSADSKTIPVEYNASNATGVIRMDAFSNVTVSFDSRSKTMEWLRSKVNLYVFYELRRGRDIVSEEIVA